MSGARKAPRPRANELTAVLNASVFDAPPGDIRSDHDLHRWHSFRDKYHRAQQLGDSLPFPLQIDFELNSTCQMRCSFCIHGHETVKQRLVPFSDFARVIDEGEQHGLVSIKLNYINEPLLRRDLSVFVDYAKTHGVLNVYFATNGLLLTRERAQELIDARVNKIMVSLDAATPETFRLMRASDRLGEIQHNVRELIALRGSLGVSWPIVRVNFLKTTVNIHEADAFLQQWTGVADSIGFQEQVALPGVEETASVLPDDHDPNFKCSFPFKLVAVDSSGDILPCCTFSGRSMPLGNIATTTIHDAWNSAAMQALKRQHSCGTWGDNAVCRHCILGAK